MTENAKKSRMYKADPKAGYFILDFAGF